MEFEGAVEVPVVEDLLSARLSFRFDDREGYGRNRCANAPPFADRPIRTSSDPNAPFSICGEDVAPQSIRSPGYSHVKPGLDEKTNDKHVWSTRGILRLQPDFAEMDWTLIGGYMRRDETTPVGLAIGTAGTTPIPPFDTTQGIQIYGTNDGAGYIDPDIVRLRRRFARIALQKYPGGGPAGRERTFERSTALARELANNLEPRAYNGDYNGIGPNRLETYSITLDGTMVFGDYDVETVFGFQRYNRTNFSDADFTPNQLFESRSEDDAWQASAQLSVSRDFTENLNFEVGTFFLREVLDVNIVNIVASEQALSSPGRTYSQDQRSFFVYGTFKYNFWESFNLEGGVRYNRQRTKFDYRLGLVGDLGILITDDIEQDWDSPTGELKFSYEFPSAISSYLKYSHGWRAGKFNASANSDKGTSSVRPEKVDSFEWGLSGKFFEDRLSLDGSLFFYRYQDYQVFIVEADFGSPPEIETVNANKAQNYGAELEAIAEPVDGLKMTVNFSWLESKFLDFKDSRLKTVQIAPGPPSISAILPVVVDFTGNRLPNSPRFTVSLSVEYEFDLGRWGKLTPTYYANWSDDVYFDPTEGRGTDPGGVYLPNNAIGQNAYWIHNFRLGYRDIEGRFELAGWVRNMTNELYKVVGFDASGFQGTTINYLGQPRFYGMDLSLFW
jgi:outer membrane receptor protein involved in Fe transport